MKMTKRLLGLVLAIVMVVGMIPVVASAEIADGYTTLTGNAYAGIRSDAKDVTYLDSTYCTGSYITPASGFTEARTPMWNRTWGYGSIMEDKGTFYFRVNNTSTYYINGGSGQGGDATNGYYRTLSSVNYYHSRFYMGNYAAEFTNGFGVLPSTSTESQQYVLFDLSQLNADYFYSVVGITGSAFNLKDNNNKTNKVKFTVYASPIVTTDAQDESFVTLATSDELLNSASGEFNVFVKGYKTLKLSAAAVTAKGGTDSAWAGACVYNVHTWDEGVETKATCTEAGFKTYSCTDDGCTATYNELIGPALDHSYTGENGVCVNGCGKTVCGNEGHSYSEYTAVEGTLTEQSVCSGCGDIQTRWATLTAPALENAESITYLSDVYNTDAKVSHYVQPIHDSDWVLDANRGNKVYVFTGETSRLGVVEGSNNVDENGYREVTNYGAAHFSEIILGYPAVKYDKGLSVRPSDVGEEKHANVVFDVSEMAGDHFYAVVGMTDEGSNPKYYPGNPNNYETRYVDFELWGSVNGSTFTKLYAVEQIGGSCKTGVFNVDISDYDYIKLVCVTKGETAEASSVSWADACVYSLAESTCEHDWDEGTTAKEASCRTAGVMTYTCSVCGEAKNVSIMATGHTYEDGKCQCGAEQIAYHEATLELESLVYLNIYTKVDGEVDPDDMGLLIWTGDGAVNEEDFVVDNENVTAYPGATENNGYYAVQTPGIAAKNLGDELDMRVYWKQADGTYVYSRPTNYGPQSYAEYQLENSTDENLKKTLVAMLDYAAAAQTYFGYNTTDLANDISGVDLSAYRGAYSQEMLKAIVAVDASVAGERSEECKSILPSLILKGIITNNYRFLFDGEIESAKVMFWSADKYAELLAAGTALSAENASVVKEMTMGQDGYFKGGYDKTAVKDLGDTLYLCAEATAADGTVYTSGVIAHSAHDYIANMLGSGIENLDALLQALTVYGDSADTYFANR